MNDPKKDALIAFDLARASAINTFADMERSMASLFAFLLGAEIQKAYFVWARIQSPRIMRQVLSGLMKMQHGDKHWPFFKSLMKEISELDNDRDKIVHWLVLVSTTGGQEFNPETDISLKQHPDIFGEEQMFKSQVVAFQKKADFFRLMVFYFEIFLKFGPAGPPAGVMPKWPEIFQQPTGYPPPMGHPLYLSDTVL